MDSRMPLALPPGLHDNGTPFQSKGRWHRGNLVRFHDDEIEPVGGWARILGTDGLELDEVVGTPRGVLSWVSTEGGARIAIGTTSTLNVIEGSELFDITPAGFTAGGEDSDAAPYGENDYGFGPYGGDDAPSTVGPGVWLMDNFGDFLLGLSTHDGKLYVWEGDTGLDATLISEAPVDNLGLVVTPERFVFLLGAGGDPRKVQWPTQETLTDWTPSDVNSAGDWDLASNGALRTGRRGRGQTLLWTTTDFWSATYIGAPLFYRFDQLGTGCGIVSHAAAVVVDGAAFWMGLHNFFRYNGYVEPIKCEVHDLVFNNINRSQIGKAWATHISRFGEVWWFYPSAVSTQVDRYVAYNYRANTWSAGALARSAGTDEGATQHPVMAGADGALYWHEYLNDRGDEVPFLESGPFELSNGDHLLSIERIFPDELNVGDVEVSFFTANSQTDAETERGPFSATQPAFTRFKARQVRLRLEETSQGRGTSWRIGTFKFGIKQSSRR